MTKHLAFACSLIMASAAAFAEPCVSPTFDVPLPGAHDVTSHVTDVSSSQFPAFWQEGRLDGYAYKIFANGTGILFGTDAQTSWTIDVRCDVTSETCDFTEKGQPPDVAGSVAVRIGQCLVPAFVLPRVSNTEIVQEVAEQAVVVNQAQPINEENVPQQDQSDQMCGVALTDEPTEVATMQRLLVLLGENPGPVDGFLGPRSFAAMNAFVEKADWGTSIPDLISELDAIHCALVQ